MAGANGTLQKEDVDKAEHVLLNETSVVLFQFETPLETTEYLINKLSTENSKCNLKKNTKIYILSITTKNKTNRINILSNSLWY